MVTPTHWGNASAVISAWPTGCSSSVPYFMTLNDGSDAIPWFQVDLLYLANVTGVRLFPRSDVNGGGMAPLVIGLSNTSFTPGGTVSTAPLQPGTICFNVSGAITQSITVPCVGTARYVYVQMPSMPMVSGSYYFTNYLSVCALLVYGSFPGGTVIGSGATLLPGVTPASVAIAATSANIAAYAPVQASTMSGGIQNLNYMVTPTQWANSSVLAAGVGGGSTCPGSTATFFESVTDGTDTRPWFQVDLLYLASITAVQLWRRQDTLSYLGPISIVITNSTFTPGATTTMQANSSTPCYTLGSVVQTASITVPCVGVGRYVYVQMSSQPTYAGSTYYFGNYLSFCALLVYGSFPGGTVIGSGATLLPGVTPASVALAATGANIAAYAPAQSSTIIAGGLPYMVTPTQWANSSALAAGGRNTCPGSSAAYFGTVNDGTDTRPWFQVDLLYLASITAVQLWRRQNYLSYLAPISIVITNSTLTPGATTTMQANSSTACFTYSGATTTASITVPCVGVGRYVYVQARLPRL